MDILDVLLAKAMSPQGQINTYAARAQRAVTNANTAVNQATAAMEHIDELTEATEANNTVSAAARDKVDQALTDVNAALADLETAINSIDNTIMDNIESDVHNIAQDEIDSLLAELISDSATNAITKSMRFTYPSGVTSTVNNIVKYYKVTGNNQDGTMTQKAITAAIQAGVGGGSTNLGSDNAGNIVVVGEDGTITPSDSVSEQDIIDLLIKSGSYNPAGTIGIQIDYQNQFITRVQEATNLNQGSDFNPYPMYGGRKRCLVNDAGRIIAFYGDNNYTDNPSNGYQVMVYQPKFYYSRTPLKMNDARVGKIVRKETIVISATEQVGFKLHPLFINELGEELDYVLLPAYDGSIQTTGADSYTDGVITNFTSQKLASVSGAKPISGLNNPLTATSAEQLARNRGNGWHITNMQAQSANQMLQIIEFGSLNGQLALESGLSNVPKNSSANCAATTGSTATLGNTTGSAAQTEVNVNGTVSTYDVAGRRAISYRGMENPWGNIWHILGGINIWGDGSTAGGIPYICKNFSYDYSSIENYESVGFCLPSADNWISALGYGDPKYDWILMPAECGAGANSALPIGDNLWTTANINGINMALAGGMWSFGDSNGLFYYSCDKRPTNGARSFGAKLMHIPHTSDTYYRSNITLWQSKMGG